MSSAAYQQSAQGPVAIPVQAPNTLLSKSQNFLNADFETLKKRISSENPKLRALADNVVAALDKVKNDILEIVVKIGSVTLEKVNNNLVTSVNEETSQISTELNNLQSTIQNAISNGLKTQATLNGALTFTKTVLYSINKLNKDFFTKIQTPATSDQLQGFVSDYLNGVQNEVIKANSQIPPPEIPKQHQTNPLVAQIIDILNNNFRTLLTKLSDDNANLTDLVAKVSTAILGVKKSIVDPIQLIGAITYVDNDFIDALNNDVNQINSAGDNLNNVIQKVAQDNKKLLKGPGAAVLNLASSIGAKLRSSIGQNIYDFNEELQNGITDAQLASLVNQFLNSEFASVNTDSQ